MTLSLPAKGCLALALTLTATTPNLAHATEADDAVERGSEIIVTGQLDGYRTVDTNTGTKTNTPLIDVPQSITVVTKQQLDDQAIRGVADLVRLIPGVSAGQGEGHRDQITLRGNNSTADFFVDGLRDDVQYFRSFYNIERVEVHKGPNAMVFGRGGGGGLINRVTKGAIAGETEVAGSVSTDSFGAAYGAADLNFGLGDTAGLRINGFYERLNNHRDQYKGDRYAINPVIGFALGENGKAQLSYEYVRDDRVVDRGIPSLFGGVLGAPARPLADKAYFRTFFGVPGINETGFKAHVVQYKSEVALTPALKLTTQALYGDYDKLYTNVFTAIPADFRPATPVTAVEAYRDLTHRKNLIGQTNLEWRGKTGGIEHILLIGGEFSDQKTVNERINGFFDATLTAASRRRAIALTNPPVIPAVQFVAGPAGNSNRAARTHLRQASLYIQDQISFGDHVDLIGGVRYDRFDLSARNLFTNATFQRTDTLWSPRVGLVLKPNESASLYASFSRSYLPQSGDQFNTLDVTLAALEPEEFDNYELGAKWLVTPGLTLTAAIYQLDRTNTRAAGPVPGTIVLTGAQRTKGFEFGLTGRLTDKWQTAIGYALTSARISATTTAAPAGRAVAQVPRHQLSLWNRYDFSRRFGAGLGLYHQSRQFATISNTVELPAYTRIDAALFYKLTNKIEAQLNLENLTDERYFPNAHNDNNISPGAPFNARFTVNVRF